MSLTPVAWLDVSKIVPMYECGYRYGILLKTAQEINTKTVNIYSFNNN